MGEEGSLNGFFIFTITDRQGPTWLQVSRHDGSPCLGLEPVPEEFRAPVAFRPRGLPLVSLSPCVALGLPPVETSDLPTGQSNRALFPVGLVVPCL